MEKQPRLVASLVFAAAGSIVREEGRGGLDKGDGGEGGADQGRGEEVGEAADCEGSHDRGQQDQGWGEGENGEEEGEDGAGDAEEGEDSDATDDEEGEDSDATEDEEGKGWFDNTLDALAAALWRPPQGSGVGAIVAPAAHHPLSIGVDAPIPAKVGMRVVLTHEVTLRGEYDKNEECCLRYAHSVRCSFGSHAGKTFRRLLQEHPEFEQTCRARPKPGPLMKEFLAYCDVVKGVKQPRRRVRESIPTSLTMQDEPPWEPPTLPLCPLHGTGTICEIDDSRGEACVLWDRPKQVGSWRQHARWERRHSIGPPGDTFELALDDSDAAECDHLLFQPRIARRPVAAPPEAAGPLEQGTQAPPLRSGPPPLQGAAEKIVLPGGGHVFVMPCHASALSDEQQAAAVARRQAIAQSLETLCEELETSSSDDEAQSVEELEELEELDRPAPAPQSPGCPSARGPAPRSDQ